MWAQEHWDVKWDMMPLAKAIDGCYLPFGVTLISDRIYEGLRGSMLWHGWTQHGNPICAAAAKAALKLIIRDRLVENADKVGNYVLERLNGEFKALPSVGDIGGKGLMLGLDLVSDKATKTPFESATMSKWQREVLQKGLYIRLSLAKYHTRVRFNPPIITTREEADEMLDILYTAIADLKSR